MITLPPVGSTIIAVVVGAEGAPVIETAEVTSHGHAAFWCRSVRPGGWNDQALHLEREGQTWARETDAEAGRALLAAHALFDQAAATPLTSNLRPGQFVHHEIITHRVLK